MDSSRHKHARSANDCLSVCLCLSALMDSPLSSQLRYRRHARALDQADSKDAENHRHRQVRLGVCVSRAVRHHCRHSRQKRGSVQRGGQSSQNVRVCPVPMDPELMNVCEFDKSREVTYFFPIVSRFSLRYTHSSMSGLFNKKKTSNANSLLKERLKEKSTDDFPKQKMSPWKFNQIFRRVPTKRKRGDNF